MDNSLGNYLKELRASRSLREVAELTGLSHTYIADIENGYRRGSNKPIKPSADTLVKLSKAYGVSFVDLIEKSGIWSNMSEEDKSVMIYIYKNEEELNEKIKEQIKSLTNDEGKFSEKLHREVFDIFGFHFNFEYIDFDKSYLNYLDNLDEDNVTDSETEYIYKQFNSFYNYSEIKNKIESYNDLQEKEDFYEGLQKIINKYNYKNISDENTLFRETPSVYAVKKELDIPIEELTNHNLTYKGHVLTEEQKQHLAKLLQAAADMLEK